MKFHFANGFSVSLWSEEIEEVQVSDSCILYKTPNGRQIVIRVPKSWVASSSDSDIDNGNQNDDCNEQLRHQNTTKPEGKML